MNIRHLTPPGCAVMTAALVLSLVLAGSGSLLAAEPAPAPPATEAAPPLKSLPQQSAQIIRGWVPFLGGPAPTGTVAMIYQAVIDGDLEALRKALQGELNVNALDPRSGLNALHLAIHKRRVDIALELLKSGADVEHRGARENDSPLHMAVAEADAAMVRLLLEHGAKVDAVTRIGPHGDPTQMGDTALHQASRLGDVALARLLIEQQADINGGNHMQLTPLHLAAATGNTAMSTLLLDHGAAIDQPDRIGATPLHWAVKHGHSAVVVLLLERGAGVDAKTRSGTTPLFTAVAKRHQAIIRQLMAAGADANSPGRDGETPMQRARKQNNTDSLGLLNGAK